MDLDPTQFDAAWLAAQAGAWAPALARVVGLCLTGPTTAIPGVDVRVRALLALALGVVIAPVVGPTRMAPAGVMLFLGLLLSELLVGASLGWSAGLIVAAARQAGELVGAQAGLSASALFDPETGLELTPLGQLYGLIAVGVFLAMNGPLVMTAALVESYQAIPAGTWLLDEPTISQMFIQVGSALALSLQVAAPAAVALALTGVALGWIGRLAPAVPVLAMSLPVRSLLGIALVFLGLATLAATLAQAWSRWPWGP